MIITIDGPAGAGKSTIARELARALGISYLDTGATYRAVTLKAMRAGIDLSDAGALASLAKEADIKLPAGRDGPGVLLDGQDVGGEIRSEEVSRNSYYAARSPAVREVLVSLQRRLGAALGDFVSEGRDQGTVVFPRANVKIFLDASNEVRARRRRRQLLESGEQAEYESVLESIKQRDQRDRRRSVGPLARPEGAVVIDTSGKTIEQVTAEAVRAVEAAT